MGKNEIALLRLALEAIKLLLEKQQSGEVITDEELKEAKQKRKEAVKNLND